jgi:hypothetical protein
MNTSAHYSNEGGGRTVQCPKSNVQRKGRVRAFGVWEFGVWRKPPDPETPFDKLKAGGDAVTRRETY